MGAPSDRSAVNAKNTREALYQKVRLVTRAAVQFPHLPKLLLINETLWQRLCLYSLMRETDSM